MERAWIWGWCTSYRDRLLDRVEWWWGSNSLPLHFVTGEVGGKEPDMRFGMRSEHRQGGIGGSSFTYPLALSRVLTVAFSLNSGVWAYNWYTQDSKVNISNTAASNPKGFPYNWLVFGIV